MNRGVNPTTTRIFYNQGFNSAQGSFIPSVLRNAACYGKTALRDAAYTGNTYMQQLFTGLQQQGALNGYQLIHIILTDGEDTGSGISEIDFLELNRKLGSQIPSQFLQIIYIGVDLEREGVNQISRIINSSRQNTSFKQVDNAHIIEAFEQIQFNLNIVSAQTLQGPNISLTTLEYQRHSATIEVRKKLGILFSLDASGSMESYERWDKVCYAVQRFINNLTAEDFVMAIIFDTTISIVNQQNIYTRNQRIRREQEEYQQTQRTQQNTIIYIPIKTQNNLPDIDKNICCHIF